MPSEKFKRIIQSADDTTARIVERMEQSGELSHLRGKPLQLDDDPDWLVTRVLKQQGFSHPLIERARELDEPRREAEAVVERLKRRRERLSRTHVDVLPSDVHAFNEDRPVVLQQYAEKLKALNRAITNYNLGVPTALHQRLVRVDDAVARASEEVPPLEWKPRVPQPRKRFTLWKHRP